MPDQQIVLSFAVQNQAVVTAAMDNLAASVNKNTEAIRGSFARGAQQIEAQVTGPARSSTLAVRGLGEEMGIHMPRFVSTFIASIGGVGPALASAFSVIGVIGLVEIIATQLPAAYNKLVGAITGWNDKEKKAYAEYVKDNEAAVKALHDVEVAQIHLNEVGKSGIGLKQAEAADTEKVIALRASEATDYQRRAETIRNEINKLKASLQSLREPLLGNIQVLPDLSGTKSRISELETQAEDLEKKAKEAADDVRAMRGKDQPKANKEVYAEQLADERTLAAARIEVNQKNNEVLLALAEANAKANYEIRVITESQYSDALRGIENDRFRSDSDALNKKRDLAVKEQQQTGKSMKAEIEKIDGEIEALADKHAGKLEAIDREQQARRNAHLHETVAAYEKTDEEIFQAGLSKAERDQEKDRSNLNEQLEMAQAAANRTLEIKQRDDQAMLAAHKVTLSQWEKSEKDAIDRWYAERRATIQAAIKQAQLLYKEDEAAYRRLQDQLVALDQERAQKISAVDDRVTKVQSKMIANIEKEFESGFTKWLTGQQSLEKGMIESWNHIATSIINNVINYTAQLIIAAATHKKIEDDSILASAKSAAAKVFESAVKSDIPFPFNYIAGGAAAAATFAAVAAYKSFGRGGIMDEDNMAFLHKNEMVLDPGLSQAVQNMARGGFAGGGGGGDTHLHYNPTIYGSDSEGFKRLLKQHADELTKIMKRQSRNGHLPSQGF